MIEPIFADALLDVQQFFDELPEIASRSAQLAINDVANHEGLAVMKARVIDDVNFPAGYLDDKLVATKQATLSDLTAVITGRDRPTSLARFAPGQTPANTRGRGVRIEVKPGQSKLLRNAFLVSLKNGNTGLAIRLKPGQSLTNKREIAGTVMLGKGVYLLYGPSVDQVFKWVADAARPEISTMVADEFFRQFARLSHG